MGIIALFTGRDKGRNRRQFAKYASILIFSAICVVEALIRFAKICLGS